MKKTAILVLAIVMLFAAASAAQAGAAYKPRTGDASLDATLGDLNVHTHGDSVPEFIDNISVSYNIPRVEVETWIYKVQMVPADVVMTVLTAKLLGIHVDDSQASPDDVDVILYSEFDDMHALEAYYPHPEHVKIKPFAKAIREERRVINYEV